MTPPSYVERRADRDLYDALSCGEFCYVLTARQMGKSSLMVRTAARLRQEGVAVAILDLTAIGQNLSPEQWCSGLLDHVGAQLDLEEELDGFWRAHNNLGPLQRWLTALREVVLRRVPGRIVICVDEIDAVRSLPFSTDEFFAGVRQCYNRRSEDPEFERLTFCLLGVATPSDLIRDTRLTPFNVGRRIELTDFGEAEAAPLAAGLLGSLATENTESAEKEARSTLQRVLYWTGGHPYLTQRLCRALAETQTLPLPSDASAFLSVPSAFCVAKVDQFCDALFLSKSAQETDDNLLFVRERLLRSEADLAAVLDLHRQVWAGKRVTADDTNPLVDLLRLSGVAQVVDGRLRVRNRIYARVFDRAWVTAHMPDAELRRQRAAYRQGLWRAAGVSALIVVTMGWLALTARVQTGRADQQRRRAEAQRLEARRNLYVAQMSLVQQRWEEGNVAQAQKLLAAQQPGPGREDLRGFEWRYLQRICQDQSRATLRGHTQYVQCEAISPDGKLLASGSHDRTIKLWELATRRPVATLSGHRGEVWCLAFSRDGKTLASGSADGTVKLWSIASRRPVASLGPHAGTVRAVAFSPDGKHVAAAVDDDGSVKLWSLSTRRVIASFPGPANPRPTVAFSPDGKLLAASQGDQTVRLWRLADRRAVAVLRGHRDLVVWVDFSPDGRTLATASADSLVKLWALASRREIATLRGHRKWVTSAVFSPDGRMLATSCVDGTLKLWDVATRQELATLKGHQNWVNQVVFSPDGRTVASACDDQTVKLWDAQPKPDTVLLRGHDTIIRGVAFSPDGRLLATQSRAGTVRLWGVPSGLPLASLRLRRSSSPSLWLPSVVFSPDRQMLATADGNGVIALWSIALRRTVARLQGHRGEVLSLVFSPDGRMLASSGFDGAIRLWDVAARRGRSIVPGHEAALTLLTFLPDGHTLACVGRAGRIRWYDARTGQEVARAQPGRRAPYQATLAPDGRTAALMGTDAILQVWDLVARRRVAAFPGEWADWTTFSPDGRLLAASGGNNSIRLWDIATGRQWGTLQSYGGLLEVVAFCPDGRTLASCSHDSTLRLWNLTVQQEVITLPGVPLGKMLFSPDGNTLALAGGDTTVRLWHAAALSDERRSR